MSTSRVFSLFVALALVVVAVLVVQAGIATSALTPNDRARRADVARWVAMGEYYTGVNPDARRAREADVARWVAMGEFYAKIGAPSNAGRAALIASARYTGLALLEYERTGNPKFLPRCIAPQMMAELPAHIGSNQWKSVVGVCGE